MPTSVSFHSSSIYAAYIARICFRSRGVVAVEQALRYGDELANRQGERNEDVEEGGGFGMRGCDAGV
jgi:hypothetical protein